MDAQRAVDGGADDARRKDLAAGRRCEAAVAMPKAVTPPVHDGLMGKRANGRAQLKKNVDRFLGRHTTRRTIRYPQRGKTRRHGVRR